ncbi:MAG: HAD-IIB family hydrolase [Pseudomonadota bacterium]
MDCVFLFDVDGTLTPPRQPMKTMFADYFRGFVKREPVFLISGSDYSKIKEQVPLDILNDCHGVFGCSGAEYFEMDELVYRREHQFSTELVERVERFIEESPYEYRFGNHIEHRPGMLNVSVVGRNATLNQRRHYHEWDLAHGERSVFANRLVELFDEYEASCGGEISIDIVPNGWTKSVVKSEVIEKHPGAQLIFFGDRMGEQGNDRPLADVLNTPSGRHKAIEVKDYKDTWVHLRHLSGLQESKTRFRLDNVKELFTVGATFH